MVNEWLRSSDWKEFHTVGPAAWIGSCDDHIVLLKLDRCSGDHRGVAECYHQITWLTLKVDADRDEHSVTLRERDLRETFWVAVRTCWHRRVSCQKKPCRQPRPSDASSLWRCQCCCCCCWWVMWSMNYQCTAGGDHFRRRLTSASLAVSHRIIARHVDITSPCSVDIALLVRQFITVSSRCAEEASASLRVRSSLRVK